MSIIFLLLPLLPLDVVTREDDEAVEAAVGLEVVAVQDCMAEDTSFRVETSSSSLVRFSLFFVVVVVAEVVLGDDSVKKMK